MCCTSLGEPLPTQSNELQWQRTSREKRLWPLTAPASWDWSRGNLNKTLVRYWRFSMVMAHCFACNTLNYFINVSMCWFRWIWSSMQHKKICLTLWLPHLDTICFYTTGNVGPLVHVSRNAQHPVESTDSHRVTQLVCENRKNKGIILKGVVFCCLVIFEQTCMLPENRCQEKQSEALRTKICLCANHTPC